MFGYLIKFNHQVQIVELEISPSVRVHLIQRTEIMVCGVKSCNIILYSDNICYIRAFFSYEFLKDKQ